MRTHVFRLNLGIEPGASASITLGRSLSACLVLLLSATSREGGRREEGGKRSAPIGSVTSLAAGHHPDVGEGVRDETYEVESPIWSETESREGRWRGKRSARELIGGAGQGASHVRRLPKRQSGEGEIGLTRQSQTCQPCRTVSQSTNKNNRSQLQPRIDVIQGTGKKGGGRTNGAGLARSGRSRTRGRLERELSGSEGLGGHR